MDWNDWLSDTAQGARASDIRELLKLTAQPHMISLAGGLPDPNIFPLQEYQAVLGQVLAKHGANALQYSPTEGISLLREAMLANLRQEGLKLPDISNLLFTSGSQQALELIGQLLINPGDVMLVEAPTYVGALQAFNPRQPHYELAAMDSEGLQIEQLQVQIQQLKRQSQHPKLLYTIPTFQNPTGVTMSLARRQALIELAERENFLIIEDDPYSQLRFAGQQMPSLKQLADAQNSERVVLLRTFSKTVAPGLRTGYVVGPSELLRKLAILKQGADLCSSALNQFFIYELLNTNLMQEYVERARATYRDKASVMSTSLQNAGLKELGVTWTEPQGGMFLWVQLPDALDAGQLLARAIELGVAYVKGAAFYPENGAGLGSNCFRLNFSQPSPTQIQTGIARLAEVVTASLDLAVAAR